MNKLHNLENERISNISEDLYNFLIDYLLPTYGLKLDKLSDMDLVSICNQLLDNSINAKNE